MDMRGNASSTVTAEGLRIPATNIFGEDGKGFDIMMGTVLPWFSVPTASIAMPVCGGAAFHKEAGIERLFRAARAARVMAPTTDVLYDFIGKAVTGLPLFWT